MNEPAGRDWRRLEPLLRRAAHIPLYRELWRGCDALAIAREPACFSALPLLTKDRLREFPIADRLDPHRTGAPPTITRTSGSTGAPLELAFDAATLRSRQLRFLRALFESGYRPPGRVLLVSSRTSDSIKRVSRISRWLGWHYVDLYDGAVRLAEAQTRLAPQVLYAPLAALQLLAEERRDAPNGSRPKVVISTSERLSAHARRDLEAVFGTSVTDFYGMTESGLIAWRSSERESYRLASESLYVEFVRRPEHGDFEELIVTEFHGGAAPLIRYATGDLVRRGAHGEVLEIVGKELDCLWRVDGSRISPYEIDAVFIDDPEIRHYQVVQQVDLSVDVAVERSGPLDSLRVRLVGVLGPGIALRLGRWTSDAPLSHKARPIRSLAKRP
jgi:phenylacetate-coenzyme A ligase PaaK-like adenylate-forming protein